MPNLGTYGLDPMGGGVATAQNEPISAPGIGGPGPMAFGGDMQEFMKKALMEQYERKKREQDMAMRNAEIERNRMLQQRREDDMRSSGLGAASHLGRQSSGEARPDIGGMDSFQRSSAADQLHQTSGLAPTRMVGGPGMIAGRTLDPLAMGVAQRQAFLPQGSSFERGGASAPSLDSMIGPEGSSRTPGYETPEEARQRISRGSQTVYGRR